MIHRPILRIAVPALSITGVLLLSGCGQGVSGPATETAQAAGATVNNCGYQVTVDKAPERVVAMTPGLTDLADRLGAADRIVGVAQTRNAVLPTAVSDNEDIAILTQDGPPSREVLLNTSPDLVLSPTTYEFTAEQGFASQEQLSEAGAEAYISTAGCPDRRSSAEVTDLLTDIDNLGALLGQPEQAAKVKEQAQRELDDVSNAVAGLDQPTVAQVYVEAETLMAIGAGVEYDMIRRAGGDNVFSPDDAAFRDFFAATISPETLVEKNPEAIVFSAANDKQVEATRAYLKKHFPEVKAVTDDRLINIGADQVMPGSWGNIDAVRTIAEGLYPGKV